MADKYIIHSAAFNGDGTSSAEATVAGGVGAWNDIAYFVQGTAPAFGTLAAGDAVYIRSKTPAGANITITLGATVAPGSANATASSWITWVIDAGTVWAGVSGVVTIDQAASWQIQIRSYNRVVCRAQDNLVMRTNNAAHNGTFVSLAHCALNGVLIDMGLVTSNGACILSGSNAHAVLTDCHLIIRARFSSLISQGNWGRITLVNSDIEVLSVASEPLFKIGGSGGVIEAYGGQIRGAGATSGSTVGRITTGDIRTFGLQFPNTMKVVDVYPNFATQSSGTFHGLGSDGGVGANIATIWGEADTRNDGNYPSLSSTLLNSTNTPFTWRIYQAAASRSAPSSITTQGMYQQAAAIKTITAELQVATTFSPLLTTENTWLDITYIDNATGLTKSVSTRALVGVALDTSVAAWSATTYGAVALHKRKISVATPTAVKQDTAILVTLRSLAIPGSTSDLIFFDPAVNVA